RPSLSPPPSYTVSLHDALPISRFIREIGVVFCPNQNEIRLPLPRLLHGFPAGQHPGSVVRHFPKALQESANQTPNRLPHRNQHGDRKSTRLNSSHGSISYAVFC